MNDNEQISFFDRPESQPLAARLRPRTLEEFVGQKHLVGEGGVLRRLIESDNISSMIFCPSSISPPSPAASGRSAP